MCEMYIVCVKCLKNARCVKSIRCVRCCSIDMCEVSVMDEDWKQGSFFLFPSFSLHCQSLFSSTRFWLMRKGVSEWEPYVELGFGLKHHSLRGASGKTICRPIRAYY